MGKYVKSHYWEIVLPFLIGSFTIWLLGPGWVLPLALLSVTIWGLVLPDLKRDSGVAIKALLGMIAALLFITAVMWLYAGNTLRF